MAVKKQKKEKFIEPYFKDMVEVWFSFCRDKFNEDPTFDGSSPRDLKSIIKTLRDRATKANIEWTLFVAQSRFHNFLIFCFADQWLRNNWILFNINRQKDRIFFSKSQIH